MRNKKILRGSLSHQGLNILKEIFKPGRSRHIDKINGIEGEYIYSIGSMETKTKDIFRFTKFVKRTWPEIKKINQITRDMAATYIYYRIFVGNSEGYIARIAASIRKLNMAMRKFCLISKDAPTLLPYEITRGMHAETNTDSYTEEEAEDIIEWVGKRNKEIEVYLKVLWAIGCRAQEGAYLRADNIDPENLKISLDGNKNRTKGGRDREFVVLEKARGFLGFLVLEEQKSESGHIFNDRRGLPKKARTLVNRACEELEIEKKPQSLHAFRKTFASEKFIQVIELGYGAETAKKMTSQALGHNRPDVVGQSYIDLDAVSYHLKGPRLSNDS